MPRSAGDAGRPVTGAGRDAVYRRINGGLPPMRPDQGRTGSHNSVLPPPTPGTVFARVVIIYGTGLTGEFIYAGKPAPGNTPVAWAIPPGVTTDPFGNTLNNPAPTGGFITRQTVASGGLISQLTAGSLIFNDLDAPYTLSADGEIVLIHVSSSSDDPILALNSPAADSAGTHSTIWMLGYAPGGSGNTQVAIFGANDLAVTSPCDLIQCGPLIFSTFNGALFTFGAQLQGTAGDLTVSSLDSNTYDTERLAQRITSPVTISAVNPIFNNIGIPWNVATGALTGNAYILHAHMVYTEGAAGTPRFQWATGGGAVVNVSEMTSQWQLNNANTTFGGAGAGAASSIGPNAGPAMSGQAQPWIVDIWASAEFSGSGDIQFQGSTTNNAWTILAGSFIEMFPVTV